MVKKEFTASKVCICFASAMTAISLLLNSLLYRESLMAELRKKIDKRYLLDTPEIRSIHEAEEAQNELVVIDRSDIADRLRSYNNILNISRLKNAINTLLIAGVGLAGVFGIIGLVRKVAKEKK